MKVLHVCSEEAVPMKNIYKTYEKQFKKTGVNSKLTYEPSNVENYDIVHGHYALTKPVIKSYRLAKRNNIPFIIHCHGSDVRSITLKGPEELSLKLSLVSNRVRKKADMTLLSTPDLPEWSEGLYLPNPVDLAIFKPMNIEKKDKTLLFGRFTKGGGILDIIDPKKKYDCINWGDDIKFPKNVHMLPFTPHDELPKLFNRYERMIGALVDPVSLARLEAMACGLKTYTDFPEKYTSFYGFENPDKVKNPRKFVKKYHDPKKIVKVLVGIYESLL
ncbi:MAG: glycosyltransferase [Thermoplasmata archaeon]